MVCIDVSQACSWSDSDDELIASTLSRDACRVGYAWERDELSSDDDDDVGECTTSLGAIQQRFLDSLNELRALDSEARRKPSMDAMQEFLERDLLVGRRVQEEQGRLLRSLDERHQKQYQKDKEAVHLVVARFQEEIQEKQVLEEARRQREEEQRRQEEARRQREEEQRRQEKKKEQKEREAYQLVRLASPVALETKDRLSSILAGYNGELSAFCDDPSTKDIRRRVKKFITLSVQQISATQEQVKNKARALLEFLSQQHGLHQKFALVTLASKMVSQCDAQISRLPSFAFPLAEVSVSVARAFPEYLDLLKAILQGDCPLCVPMVFEPGLKATRDAKFYKAMGYRVHDGTVESDEEYVNRLGGYVRLYAALLQVDGPPGGSELEESGLHECWRYTASLLNSVPACRSSATALDAFMSVAGYKMHARFGRQLDKLMQYVAVHFVKPLETDPASNAVAARLDTFVRDRKYLQPPSGRNMPLRDLSSQSRA
jgi:nucleoporin GLE1